MEYKFVANFRGRKIGWRNSKKILYHETCSQKVSSSAEVAKGEIGFKGDVEGLIMNKGICIASLPPTNVHFSSSS